MKNTSHKTNWHSAAYSAIKIEFSYPGLQFFTEHILNENSRRVDMLIIKKDTKLSIPNPLSSHFRTYNLIEYKSPRQALDVNSFYKSLSYAFSFKALPFDDNDVSIDEITLTMISSRYPRKLFEYLNKCKITVENKVKGVYDIYKDKNEGGFSVRVIVTSRLDASEHIWLKSLTKNLNDPQELRMLFNAYGPHQDDPEYNNYMNIIIRANQMAQKGDDTMCEALLELLEPHLQEQRDNGIQLGKQQINQLNAALVRDNRSDDLIRSFTDPAFQATLLEEYHLL